MPPPLSIMFAIVCLCTLSMCASIHRVDCVLYCMVCPGVLKVLFELVQDSAHQRIQHLELEQRFESFMFARGHGVPA